MMATPPHGSSEVDTGSIATSLSRLRVGSRTVSETPKSHYSERTRRVVSRASAKRTLFTGTTADHEPVHGAATKSASGLSKHSSSHSVSHRFPPWTLQEDRALVAFMLLYTEATSWSSRAGKGDQLWEKAGEHVQHTVNSDYCRTGKSLILLNLFIYNYHVLETSDM